MEPTWQQLLALSPLVLLPYVLWQTITFWRLTRRQWNVEKSWRKTCAEKFLH